MMLATTALTVAFALAATRSAPQYQATAEILVGPTITPSGNYIPATMPTEQRVATSGSVVTAAASRLGMSTTQALKQVTVTVPVDTQLLDITFTAATPRRALEGATAFTREYLAYRNPPDTKHPVAAQVTPPNLPTSPVKPDYPLILGVAVIGGLMLGFGAAWSWDRVRGRLRTVADVRRSTGLDVIGTVPRLSKPGRLVEQPAPAERPPFDLLVARVPGLAESREELSILVTGADHGSGTSTVALQTALALVRLGRRVVLVTTDQRVVAGLQRDGHRLSTAEAATWSGGGVRETRIPRLQLASPTDDGGDAAVGLDRLAQKIRTLALDSVVVVDGPPAELCTALALAVDRVLLVVGLGHGSRASATAARAALEHVADKVVGCVVTMPRRPGRHVAAAPVPARAPAKVPAKVPSAAPRQEQQPGDHPASRPRPLPLPTSPAPSWEERLAEAAKPLGAPANGKDGNAEPVSEAAAVPEPDTRPGLRPVTAPEPGGLSRIGSVARAGKPSPRGPVPG
jgi:capsular polysaccharide biosynthesis protein